MNEVSNKQEITLEDLATMVARGFEDITNRMATKDDLAYEIGRLESKMATKDDIANMATKDDIAGLKKEIDELRLSINHYLELSEKRYLELRHRQDIIIKWVSKLSAHNHIPIDLKELEYK